MFKIMLFLRRKPDLTFEEFRDYYENNHAPLGARLMPNARRYRRRFLSLEASVPMPGEDSAAGYDVLTEVWFDDRAAFEKTVADIASNHPGVLEADEAKLFDETRLVVSVMEECETPMEARS